MENSLQNCVPSPLRTPSNKRSSSVDMQGFNNSRKASETPNSSKGERQRSPNSSRRHIHTSSSGSNSSGLTPSSLALPVTPILHSTGSCVDDRTLTNMSSTGQQDSVATPCAPSGSSSKATDDVHADDDQEMGYSGENSTNFGDDVDGAGAAISSHQDSPEYQRIRIEMDHIHSKVNKTKELIREEQTARDENVNEYLRLASQADKQQQIRLKAVFEKKNTKSSQQMQALQRKLDTYQRRLKALEAQGITRSQPHRAPKQVLRGVGIGIKSVITKPKEFAHLIRNKFGSADNISHIRSLEGNPANPGAPDEFFVTSPSSSSALNAGNSSSLPGHASQSTSTPLQSGMAPAVSQGSGGGKYTSEEGSECGSSVTSESMPCGLHMSPRHNVGSNNLGLSYGLESFFQELQERREEVERLREEIEQVKLHFQQEVSYVSAALQEERFRVERLEEQINDLTELHQNEVENLKQNIADMEEKVQYQSEERLRDIHDQIDDCHTRISKVEHQAQHQQHVSLEGIENSNARAVLVKLINMALTLLQLVLVVVSTTANIISPFLKTRLRVLTTCVLALVFAFVLKQWSDLVDLGAHLIQHYKVVLTS